jgi:hypothetical protein
MKVQFYVGAITALYTELPYDDADDFCYGDLAGLFPVVSKSKHLALNSALL